MRRGVPTIIIEPRTLLREGLAALLQDSNFKVIATIPTIEELPQLAPGRVGLLIVGLARSGPDDLQLLEKLAPVRQDYKVVAVEDRTVHPSQIDILQILRSGADGYILNIQSRDVLLKSLELAFLEQKLVVLGDKCEAADLSEAGAAQPEEAAPRSNGNGFAHPALSEREREILGCLACGDSNKIIARTCCIAESTVKIHLKSILRKIHVQNRTQAAIWAIQNNMTRLRLSPPVAPASLPEPAPSELFAMCDIREPELD